jgi:hypothetical protein
MLIRAGVPGRIQEADMHVRFVTPGGVELCDAAELPTLLARTDGLVWSTCRCGTNRPSRR